MISFPRNDPVKMTHIFCQQGTVPIFVGQEWALRVTLGDFVGFLFFKIESFDNTCISMEIVRAEHRGEEYDLVHAVWNDALEEFGYNGKFYFLNSQWSIWKEMMPVAA